jgi:hypothetical protein
VQLEKSLFYKYKPLLRAISWQTFLTHSHPVPGQEKAFMTKVPDNQYLVVKRVMEWVARSIKELERAKAK